MARRLLASLLVLAFGTALMPAGAAAAGLVSEDHAFPAPAVDSLDIDAAFAPNGFAAVAWVEQIAADESVVNVALRPPGQDWSPPARLTTRENAGDPPSGRSLRNVQVAVNSNGDAAAAWEENKSPSTLTVAVSSRPAGGEFRKPELIDPGITPLVGVDASGEVTFVNGFNTASSDGEVVRSAPAGASLAGATPQPLSTTCGPFDADLAVAPSGDAILGFGCDGMAFSVRRNGTWMTSTPFMNSIVTCPTIGTSTVYFGVRVAMDGEGHPVGVVQRTDSSSSCGMFPTTSRSNSILLALPAGGLMAAGPQVAASGVGFDINPVPNNVFSPDVGIGGDSVVVEWLSGNDTGFAFRPSTRTYPDNGAGAPGPSEPIGSFGGSAAFGEVGVGAAGNALVTWIQSVEGTFLEFAAFRAAGGSFGQPLPVSDFSNDVPGSSADVSDQGDGVIAYLQGPTPGRVAHARGFDAAPPQPTGVSIPATADLGLAAPFAAGAFDVWGPVSFAWDFGDGTAAAGATPTHVFTSAGPKSVTLTATDFAGNSAATGAVVDVRRSAPLLTNVSATNSVFRVGRRPTPTAAGRRRRAPVGTTFRFSLDRPASVAIRLARALPGRRSGRRCVKPTKRLARKKRCTRFVMRGTLRRVSGPGANRVAFSGRIGRRALKPGRYRASFVATAFGVSSTARALRFRIVR